MQDCAEMCGLESSDPCTWQALEDGDFCVTKSNIPFCSIGPDNGIEQKNESNNESYRRNYRYHTEGGNS